MRAVLQLLRAPLAASAVANAAVALALLPAAAPEPAALLLALASACLYWAGMSLNDYFDRDRDRALHPARPLPSGRVGEGTALVLGLGLLVAGVAAAAGAGRAAGATRAGLGAGLLVAACVLAYDAWLKRHRLAGTLSMSSCRVANALAPALVLAGGVPPLALAYALVLGLYVAGLTWLSTYEDEDAPPAALAVGLAATLAAPLLLGLATLRAPPGLELAPATWLGAAPLAALVLAQGVLAIERGTRARGERTTLALLRGVWALDLALALGTRSYATAALVAGLYVASRLGMSALFAR